MLQFSLYGDLLRKIRRTDVPYVQISAGIMSVSFFLPLLSRCPPYLLSRCSSISVALVYLLSPIACPLPPVYAGAPLASLKYVVFSTPSLISL